MGSRTFEWRKKCIFINMCMIKGWKTLCCVRHALMKAHLLAPVAEISCQLLFKCFFPLFFFSALAFRKLGDITQSLTSFWFCFSLGRDFWFSTLLYLGLFLFPVLILEICIPFVKEKVVEEREKRHNTHTRSFLFFLTQNGRSICIIIIIERPEVNLSIIIIITIAQKKMGRPERKVHHNHRAAPTLKAKREIG